MPKFDSKAPRAPEPGPILKTLKISDADESVARALACALVLQWDALPDAVQDLLIDQAVISHDVTKPVTPGAVESFIRSAKAVALAARVTAQS